MGLGSGGSQAAEADELAKLIEKFRECDPEPVNTKAGALSYCSSSGTGASCLADMLVY